MASCNANRCHITCENGCGCVYVYEEDRCDCECFGDGGRGLSGLKVALTATVDVSVSGLPLSQVAAKFDRFLAHDVLLPVARSNEPVDLELKGVTVGAALKSLGLPTRKPTTTVTPR